MPKLGVIQTVLSMTVRDRGLAALLGVCVGDALGARYEFKSAGNTKKAMSKDREADKDKQLPMLGGGPFRLPPGRVTDDSELTMALARSLVAEGGLDPEALARAYRRWAHSRPADIGHATKAAFTVPDSETCVAEAMRANAAAHNAGSRSNGALMRCVPLALPCSWSEAVRDEACTEMTRLTHPADEVALCTQLYVGAVHGLVHGESPSAVYAAMRVRAASSKQLTRLLMAAQEGCTPVHVPDVGEIKGDARCMGYMGVALQAAVHVLLHAESYRDGLEKVLGIGASYNDRWTGGDTDTNACIAGGLLGARFGTKSLPKQWRDTTVQCPPRFEDAGLGDVESLVDKLLDL